MNVIKTVSQIRIEKKNKTRAIKTGRKGYWFASDLKVDL